MAALDFPNTPSVGQLATLTNGVTYRWDGAVWTAGLPSAPPSGPASGDLTGTYPGPTIGAAKVTRAKIAADAWLSPIPVDPADVTKVLTVTAGPVLTWQTPQVVQGITATWNYRTVDGTGDPGARNLSPDVTAAPTFLRFSTTDTAGSDVRNVLVTTGVGDVLLAQQRTDASKWSKLQVRAPVVDHGTWFEVPISLLANSGAGTPTNNTDVAVQFQRGTGSTSYPPSGPAGGDLTGSTYPNPTIAAGAVTNAKIADVAYAKVTGAPTSLPPSGAAAGDLSGTYPSPQIAAGVIVDADVSATAAIQYSKLTGVPTALPPSGAASGSLAGSYPGPTLTTTGVAAGTYGTAAKVARVTLTTEGRVSAVTEVDIAPTGGSPSGPAGGDLAGTYPNPTLTAAAKSKWTTAGATITPTDPAAVVTLAPIKSPLQWGTAAPKGRLGNDATGTVTSLTVNTTAGNLADDSAKAAWSVNLDAAGDSFALWRAPASASTLAFTRVLLCDGAGNVTVTGTVTVGTTTGWIHLQNRASLQADGSTRFDLLANEPQTLGYTVGASGQIFRLDYANDAVSVYRRAAGTTTYTNTFRLDGAGNLTISGATATKAAPGTAWVNPSDRRLKKNIVEDPRGLDAIRALRPVLYQFNGLGGTPDDGQTHHGLIADEVAPVMPEAVGSAPLKLHAADTDPTEILTLDVSNVTYALINAVKELAARVAVLEAQLAALVPAAS